LINGAFVCGVDVTSVQMLVSVTPQENRSIYIAIYMVVTSVLGASLGYLCGGTLLDWMGDLRFRLLGLDIDRYKLLFTGASVLRLGVILALLPWMASAITNHAEQNLPAEKEG
jgi:MFS family permease